MSTGRVFELTKALGNALKETEEYQTMRLAERRVYERPEISEQLEKYNALADLVEQEFYNKKDDRLKAVPADLYKSIRSMRFDS